MFSFKRFVVLAVAGAALCTTGGDALAAEITITGGTAVEGDAAIEFTATAENVRSAYDAKVWWRTVDDGPDAGTALPNVDYVPRSGWFVMSGDVPASVKFQVPLLGDHAEEEDETIAVEVTGYEADGISVPPVGEPILATISDDDGTPPPSAPAPDAPASSQAPGAGGTGGPDGAAGAALPAGPAEQLPPPADAAMYPPPDAGGYAPYASAAVGAAGGAPTGLGLDLVGISRGQAAVALSCETPQTCTGKVRIKATKAGRLLTLATKRYRVRADRTKVVRLALSPAERKLVAKLGELTVEATGTDGMLTAEHFGV